MLLTAHNRTSPLATEIQKRFYVEPINGIFFGILNRKSGLQIPVSHFSAERTRVSPLSHSVSHYRIKHQQNGSKERFCPFLLYINAFAKPPISMLSSHLGASFMD